MVKPALLSLLLSVPVAAQSPEPLLRIAFSDNPVGPYDEAMARADFGPGVQFSKITAGRARIKADPTTGKNVLEVKYPKGCLGSGECAIQLRAFFPAQETAWVAYRLRFEQGFSWQRGGKLPGLCGGQCNTGCVGVSGRDGWSARMMWRGAGSLVQYMYIPGKQSSCGDDYDWDMAPIVPGAWHELKNQIVLNTPGSGGAGKADGVMRSWLDGRLVLDRRNVRFRDDAALKIDQFYFSTFHGGSSDAWRPAVDSYLSFSDITVSAVDPATLSSRIRRGAFGDAAWSAAWSGGRLRLEGPGGRTSWTVADLHGRVLAAFESRGPGATPLALRPGLYLLKWSGAAGTGSLRLAAF